MAIRYGVPYVEFWNLTPKAISIYRKVFEDKLQDEYDRINYAAWLNGMYIMNSIAACIDKKAKYPDKPLKSESVEITDDSEESASIGEAKFLEYISAYNNVLNRKDGEVSGE